MRSICPLSPAQTPTFLLRDDQSTQSLLITCLVSRMATMKGVARKQRRRQCGGAALILGSLFAVCATSVSAQEACANADPSSANFSNASVLAFLTCTCVQDDALCALFAQFGAFEWRAPPCMSRARRAAVMMMKWSSHMPTQCFNFDSPPIPDNCF